MHTQNYMIIYLLYTQHRNISCKVYVCFQVNYLASPREDGDTVISSSYVIKLLLHKFLTNAVAERRQGRL